MKPKYIYSYIVVLQTSLAIARTYPNYGYYDPFPPKNQVLYNFSPISESHDNNFYDDKTKSSKLGEGKLYDSNPDIEGRKKFEMGNLSRRYGGENMEEFPKFSFEK